MPVDIEDRRRKILSIIINTYMSSGVPVSSRAICSKYRLGLCPASVRNIMADLEELGLITHLHTSAGRVPTDKGYRFYVDHILGKVVLTSQEQAQINKNLLETRIALEDIIRKVSKVLSEFTKYTGVVSQPIIRRSYFRRIQISWLGDKKICITMITNTGFTKTALVSADLGIDREKLKRIEDFMNAELEDTLLSQVRTKLRRMMLEERNQFFDLLKQAMEFIDLSSCVDEDTHIYFEGLGNILNFSEFSNWEKMCLLIRFFDENRAFTDLIQEIIDEEPKYNRIKVFIGQENSRNFLGDCSLVLGTYSVNEQVVGGLGVLGPKRMDYGKVIATVSHVSDILSNTLSRFSV